MTFPLSDCVAHSDEVVFAELEDLVVMLDTNSGMYYELDTIGSRIWNLMEPKTSVDRLLDVLMGEYDVAADTCRDDVLAFLEELITLELARHIQT